MLVFVGRVVTGSRIGIPTTTIITIKRIRVVLRILLDRRAFLRVGRCRVGKAVAAAPKQNRAGEKRGGKEGADSGRVRAFHGTTGLLA